MDCCQVTVLGFVHLYVFHFLVCVCMDCNQVTVLSFAVVLFSLLVCQHPSTVALFSVWSLHVACRNVFFC